MAHPRLASALAVLALLVAGSAPRAASFDCARAATGPERTICADAGLSALDDQLDAAYTSAAARTDAPGQLRAEQRRWLSQRNRCASSACLYAAYRGRIAELDAVEANTQSAQRRPESCRQSRGVAQAQVLVRQCIQVSPASRPPCHESNPCSMIVDEIERGCSLLSGSVPPFCP